MVVLAFHYKNNGQQGHICCGMLMAFGVKTLRPIQNGRHFPDDIFKCIFLFKNIWIWIKISLKFVSKVRINNIPALVQIMAWCRIGNKPLFEPMMVNLLTHICVTRPQWVKRNWSALIGLMTCCPVGNRPFQEPLLLNLLLSPHGQGFKTNVHCNDVTWMSRRIESRFVKQLIQANTKETI